MAWVAGVDEVGRGPLAGPVVAAAVVLPLDFALPGLADSKKLSPSRRAALAAILRDCVADWGLGCVAPSEIDRINIHQATLLAMYRALTALQRLPDHLVVDGLHVPGGPWTGTAIIGGDRLEPAISAASILAKVWRDDWMLGLHERYPMYGFDRHKGYPTEAHRRALEQYGPCLEHRRSFGPVARCTPVISSGPERSLMAGRHFGMNSRR